MGKRRRIPRSARPEPVTPGDIAPDDYVNVAATYKLAAEAIEAVGLDVHPDLVAAVARDAYEEATSRRWREWREKKKARRPGR